jgi:hypothetical protein
MSESESGHPCEQTHRIKCLIRERGSNLTTAFVFVLGDAGVRWNSREHGDMPRLPFW